MSDKKAKASQHDIEIARELSSAERESEIVSERYDHDEVMTELRSRIIATQNNK